MIHKKKIATSLQKQLIRLNEIKIKMLWKRRIEPTPMGVEAGIQVELVTCIGILRFTLLHYEMEYKRSGILTVNGFISATQRFKMSEITKQKAFLKQSKCVRFDYLQFWSSLLCQFSFASSGCFFIITGKHPIEMQNVRKDLA